MSDHLRIGHDKVSLVFWTLCVHIVFHPELECVLVHLQFLQTSLGLSQGGEHALQLIVDHAVAAFCCLVRLGSDSLLGREAFCNFSIIALFLVAL